MDYQFRMDKYNTEDRKNTEELMKMLGLRETLDKMAKANGVKMVWTCG